MHCWICEQANDNKKGNYKYVEAQMEEQLDAEVDGEFDDPSILQVCLCLSKYLSLRLCYRKMQSDH
jgi:hypothetical protein